MCQTGIELFMLIAGIYCLVAGKVPSFFFGSRYQVSGMPARWVGLMFALPAPGAFLAGVLLARLGGQDAMAHASAVETGLLVGCLLAALAVGYRFRQPVEPPRSGEPSP